MTHGVASTIADAQLCTIPLACGETKDASLCTAYDEFLNARTTMQAIDPTDQNAAQATDIAEDYLSAVHRLEQAADGRYGQKLETLDIAVNDVILTLSSVQDDADYTTWAPLVEDDLALAEDAAAQVVASIAPSCASVVSVEPAEPAAPATTQAPEKSGT